MLKRYTMYRGKRPDEDPLPEGLRQDTRKHTRHILRPPAELVAAFLANDDPLPWNNFRIAYIRCINKRFCIDPSPFEKLAALAETKDVSLGCSCPTRKNPDVNHCHTVTALKFMKDKFPKLKVEFPA